GFQLPGLEISNYPNPVETSKFDFTLYALEQKDSLYISFDYSLDLYNSSTIAEMLDQHPAVEQVFFPGLKHNPGHEIASRQMADFGGMIALELTGGYEAAVAMLNRLKLAKLAVSLGDAETLVQHPASMTHSVCSPEERAEQGISESLVRISAGLEAVEDIIADLEQALR
ncbi:MAG: PLP-dependent transferase, partial [Porticoccaceae bacterium]